VQSSRSGNTAGLINGQQCPICGYECEAFEPGPAGRRQRSMCPQCRSLERHRLTWLYVSTETELLNPAKPVRMLYVAPEVSIVPRLERLAHVDLLTADLDSSYAMVEMDITDIHLPDGSFDVIFCSHVLEHVPDDRLAMRELYRVLSPGGWAILHVPLWRPQTDEDSSVTDPAERTRRFGQHDHVRHYGIADFPARLAEAGFQVTVDDYCRRVGLACAERYGLLAQEKIHLARKIAGSVAGSVSDPVEDLTTLGDEVSGRVQLVSGDAVVGWAWNPSAKSEHLRVRGSIDGVPFGEAVADQPRASLREAGIGDGAYGFSLPLPAAAPAPGHHSLRLEAETGHLLAPARNFTTEFAGVDDPMYILAVQ
jgi:SAM-dependent methyltransferase